MVNSFLSQKEILGIVAQPTFDSIPSEVQRYVSNGLIGTNQKGELTPLLAEKWEIDKTNTKYTVYLKRNLLWSDGTPFNASKLSYHFSDVKMTIVDPFTILFTLKKSFPLFLTYLTEPVIRPPLIGVAGLYRADAIKSKFGIITEIHLSPNKSNYPEKTYRYYENESKMLTAYKLGEITTMTVTHKDLADTFKDWNNTTITRNTDYTRLLTIFFNMDSPVLKQRDVRQAIAQAVPRSQLADLGEEASGPIPPISWAYNANLKKIQYNKQAAEKVLKKNSGDASEEATLSLSTYFEYSDIATKIQDYLSGVSFKTTLNFQQFNTLNSFDLLVAYWNVPTDPDQYFFWHSTQKSEKEGNISQLDNKKIDKLLEDGRNVTGLEERKRIYGDFQKAMNDEITALFLYYPYVYTISRK